MPMSRNRSKRHWLVCDQEGHDGEMGLIQEKSLHWWTRRRRRTLCSPGCPCQEIGQSGTGWCAHWAYEGATRFICDCHHYEEADRILPDSCNRASTAARRRRLECSWNR